MKFCQFLPAIEKYGSFIRGKLKLKRLEAGFDKQSFILKHPMHLLIILHRHRGSIQLKRL